MFKRCEDISCANITTTSNDTDMLNVGCFRSKVNFVVTMKIKPLPSRWAPSLRINQLYWTNQLKLISMISSISTSSNQSRKKSLLLSLLLYFWGNILQCIDWLRCVLYCLALVAITCCFKLSFTNNFLSRSDFFVFWL